MTDEAIGSEYPGLRHLAFWDQHHPPGRRVYVIQGESGGPIKIGSAGDVQARVRGLQTGNPDRLRILFVFPAENDLEWHLHRKLRDSRIHGEWFGGETIEEFLGFCERLAAFFIANFDPYKPVPDFRRFDSGWALKGYRGDVAVSFVSPDDLPRDSKAAERTERLLRHRQAEHARPRLKAPSESDEPLAG